MKKVFHLIILTAFFVQSVCPAWALNQRQPGESRILSVQEMKSVKGGNQSPADGSAKQGECSTAQRIPCEPNGKDGGDSQQPTDPVMLTGGKFYLPYVDVEIPGLGRETGNNLRFNRSYSSQSSYRGVLGTGWVTILDIALIDFGGGGFFLRDWDGSVFHFTYDETEDVFRDGEMTLVDSGSEWVLTKVHGTKYVFEGPNQKLLYIEDVNGNRLTFEYFQYDLGNPDSTHVKRIVDSSGQFLSFEQQYEAEVSVFPDSVLITHIFRLRSMSDHTGRTWQYQWDQEDKHLMSVIDPLGRIMSYQYAQQDPDDPILVDTNNITAVTDFNGNATLYTYDTQTDRVITMTSADNTIKKFEFNSAAGTSLDTSTMTDENGREWKYEYTLRGLTTAIIDPRNHTKQYEYDPDSNLMIVSRDELNRQTEYKYDGYNRLTEIKMPDNTSEKLEYDPDRRIRKWIKKINEAGLATTRELDVNQNVLKITDRLGKVTEHTYDAHGQMLTRKDRNGNVTSFEYDAHGNLTKVTDPLGESVSFAYDLLGRPETVTDAVGNTTQMVYDDGDRVLKTILADSSEYNYSYDDNDNLLSFTDPLGQVINYEYDKMNRLERIIDPLGNVTQFAYDRNGNLKKTTDAKGQSVDYRYNNVDRLVEVNDALSGTTRFQYNPVGNLREITDANGHTTRYNYDDRDRVKKETYPDGSEELYRYDPVGNLVKVITRAGSEIRFVYDENDRLTKKVCPSCGARFVYDDVGNLTKVVDDQTGTYVFRYDEANRLKRSIQPTGEVQYRYNPNGLRSKLIYPGGEELLYRYDELNRLKKIIDGAEEYVFRYDAASRRERVIYPNQLRSVYSYDAASRLTGLRTIGPNGLISLWEYELDPVGNKTKQTHRIRPNINPDGSRTGNLTKEQLYGYDALNRLVNVQADAVQDYQYDLLGNRTTVTDAGAATNYTANVLNQYTNVGGQAFAYDANGNLTFDGALNMTYDIENRLTQTTDGTDTVQYQYDASNRLIKKTVNGVGIRYIYDGWHVLAEVDDLGNTVRKYIHGPSVDEVLAQKEGGSTYYLTKDGLGSTREVVSASDEVLQRYDYDAFGAVTVQDVSGHVISDAPLTNYLFTGREYQQENGLYNYRNRFYHPTLGRFLQRDPVGYFDGVNVYEYVKNDPLVHIDPYGLFVYSEGIFYHNAENNEFRRLHQERLEELKRDLQDPNRQVCEIHPREPETYELMLLGLSLLGIGEGLYLLNHNRYLRVGFGRHGGRKVFRIAGEWLKKLTGKKKIDLWKGGPL